ncbi:carbamoyltransferase C-terminal domain-containing protein [Halostagnicola sp. A-GB9-2]|uniref:carbamoyltransferase family protein n=1 Tax=Halostagnicola sp. A-GB9-2 TaxID=3048066 RepID=UPI0024C07520|nr:carbamoyltransferase C-terminal domain-containing protein [Halostagnicola sp. A-GB9-2]MDJ1431835.1 carbamoyltransferase C-terminal domain-containing protein [Halostagnicola sp. A-GB9-2]
MSDYTLAFKPAIGLYGQHDPSAVLFEDGTPVFGVEEERLTRQKHAPDTFPTNAINACLEYRQLALSDLDTIFLPYDPSLRSNIRSHYFGDAIRAPGITRKISAIEEAIVTEFQSQLLPTRKIESRLEEIDTPVPPIERLSHHRCHAASAFHPSGFDESLVVTIDAKGEYDSTVVWRGDQGGLERVKTYEHPNSLGLFFAIVTEYLGYRMFNGEGKVMGLAPYGNENPQIERALRSLIDVEESYDVTELTKRWGTGHGVELLEEVFDRPRKDEPESFDQWEKDLAYTAQKLLEEIVLEIVQTHTRTVGSNNIALAGGVALNCKLNKRIRESEHVDNVFVQPVANDAGLALGAGWVGQSPATVDRLSTVYLGPEYDSNEIESQLRTTKIDYNKPDNLERYVAERIADGALVGWFQGRMEMGPRALGSRSILADPRTIDSRDQVNRFVKHREEWRPFAPSLLEEAAEEYLIDGQTSPFMIEAFDIEPEKEDELSAVVHPADSSTRPQTVREDQHGRYYRLIEAFGDITGVPVLLNTSFNDNGEPIVNTPIEAVKDFYGMGLDLLVLEDYVLEKNAVGSFPDQATNEPVTTRPARHEDRYEQKRPIRNG